MSSDLYLNLAWLPKPPSNFREVCRTIDDGASAMRAASYALDENQLLRLAQAIARLRELGRPLEPLSLFRLGVLGNATLEPLIPSLIASAARHGILLDCVKADYGQTVQEALSPSSAINRAKPDAVLCAIDYRGLPLLGTAFADPESVEERVRAALAFLQTMRENFKAHAGAVSILQTLPAPPETLFGNFDRCISGTLRSITERFNAALVDSVSSSQDLLFDVAALAETVGLAEWYSPKQWNIGKLPFDAKFLPLYADHVARIIASLRGKSRRCLILDLDNTIWGGVIGDDGLEGIVIGQGDATGEAHLELQRAALALRERGIVLAVASKNDEQTAKSVFLKHPEMLLKEDHIAVFRANWIDKAANIRSIAEELSLGLGSMVFVDDNPFERGLVRDQLPEVAVPELPEDPALYARTLSAAGYFEAVTFSDEDRKRADYYRDNAKRATLASNAADLNTYLTSLKMQITFAPFDATGRARITQLINKSNQFNLTTKRYTEPEVAALEADSAIFTLQVRLSDIFGDNGMISVVICRQGRPHTWDIDTWLMSCRVLGRGVERMVLREVLHHARQRGITKLTGTYIPTERNALVKNHYETLGFTLIEERQGSTVWELATDGAIEPAPMTVDRSGFELQAV